MKKFFLLMVLLMTTMFVKYAIGVNNICVEKLVQGVHSWDGAVLPAYLKGQPEVTILKITIPPKKALPSHYHPVINAGVLLKGTLSVYKPNGQKLVLKAGDSLIEIVNQKHFGKNEGDVPAELIVFYAGVKGQPITIK